MLTVERGGRYHRVADPRWRDPLDEKYAARRGGRWNPPDSFPVLYLCRTLGVARGNVNRLLGDEPYGPEDLKPDAGPILVDVDVPMGERVDVTRAEGCVAVGLPAAYPREGSGERARCRRIGQRAWDDGLAGVAAISAWADGEELAHFIRTRSQRPAETARHPFEAWFWPRGM